MVRTGAIDHQVIEGDRLAVSFDDLRFDKGSVTRRLFSKHVQPFAGVLVEPLSINRRDVMLECLHDLLALLVG